MRPIAIHDQVRYRLDLEPVKSLLEYLYALPQDCIDRDLSWLEDEQACMELRSIELPEDACRLKELVKYYAEPLYRKNRTLAVWYAIARAVARLIQDQDYL